MFIQTKRRKIPVGKKTLIMGILNITPDSFSDGGLYFDNPKKAVDQAKRMHIQGADIIDIGGESVRIGAKRVSVNDELHRVIPIISAIKETLGDKVMISVDTYKSQVAEKAIVEGADIINDVTGFQRDTEMPDIIAKNDVTVVITHMRNRLGIIQKNDVGVVDETKRFFKNKLILCKKYNIAKEKIIFDPGYGFCKTIEQNLTLIKEIGEFGQFGVPLLIAVSRKGSLGKILWDEFQGAIEYGTHERLSASLAATAVAVLEGAAIVRTHDVYETKNFLTVLDKFK